MRRSKLEIQLNRDIRDYKDKLWWGMTGRQIGFTLLGLAVGIVLYFLTNRLGVTVAAACCTIGVILFLALGFFKWRGQPLEVFLKIWIRGNIMTNRFLPYRPTDPACFELIHTAKTQRQERNKKK